MSVVRRRVTGTSAVMHSRDHLPPLTSVHPEDGIPELHLRGPVTLNRELNFKMLTDNLVLRRGVHDLATLTGTLAMLTGIVDLKMLTGNRVH